MEAKEQNETLRGELKCHSMYIYPSKEAGKDLSVTVLVYDKDLEDYALGYYDFQKKKWIVGSVVQMELICWCYVPLLHHLSIFNFTPMLTEPKIPQFKIDYQELFNHMHDEHGLKLLESEMNEIIHIVNKMQK